MQARFLLGPSGSGKTFRCLAEARAVLREAPFGAPLIFLAPKQATFQLERQLLADPSLPGYTRLRILSFERLAEFILVEGREDVPQLLSDEGRLMVLRALLARKREELKLFRATARLRGFAQQLSVLLQELQRFQLTPAALLKLAGQVENNGSLELKLQDLASLLHAYEQWLKEHNLQDHDRLLDLAREVLPRFSATPQPGSELKAGAAAGPASAHPFRIEKLWFDGFAALAPQEIEFLRALLPHCAEATLAFNLDRESLGGVSWLSGWSLVGRTFQQLRDRLSETPGVSCAVEWLDRDAPCTRFARNPVLQHLERYWTEPRPYVQSAEPTANRRSGAAGGARKRGSNVPRAEESSQMPTLAETVRVVVCANPEAEATWAAREIRRFVRQGGLYRETAVIVRNLENYFDPIRRVFGAFDIPFFLDRREPVGHHPLAELTRSSLRTIAFHWQPDDWFGALKTGLVHDDDAEIDRLENEALARGWKGNDWLRPIVLPDQPELSEWLERLRDKLVGPFRQLSSQLGHQPSGRQLAAGLVAFWEQLEVAERLQEWSVQPIQSKQPDVSHLVHATIWQQMQDWVDNVALAFSDDTLSLREWLPVLEAGLANQTVGVIPPALDQVLVGAIDRSRNPDLRLVFVLGMNESVFPAVPNEPNLLTSSDREELTRRGIELGPTSRLQAAQERYFGYIACTRAREGLRLSCAARDEEDRVLNRSPFLDHLQRLFPTLSIESVPARVGWKEAEHGCELAGAGLPPMASPTPAEGSEAVWGRLPEEAARGQEWREFQARLANESLTPALAEALYGRTLETSVSRLEEYAACPFRFLVTSGLHAEERRLFRVDVREQGSFQHEVLALFHQQLHHEGKRWRDLTAPEARRRIGSIAEKLILEYGHGLFQANEQSRFTARSLTASLQDFVATAVSWMSQYEFDPRAVELAFGIEEKPLPAWEIDLGKGHRLSFRGKIDRVDVWRRPETEQAWCVVIDYKSSARKLDPLLLAHGIQLQLPAYLNVLRSLVNPERIFGVKQLTPAGVFFVNLRGRYAGAKTRSEVMAGFKLTRAKAYQHTGRFDVAALSRLDNRPEVKAGDQFNYRLKNNGEVHGACREAMQRESFQAMLDSVEEHLRRMGREIYEGRVRPDPYRKGNATACDQCEYQSVCRIDPWTHPFRVLQDRGGESTPTV